MEQGTRRLLAGSGEAGGEAGLLTLLNDIPHQDVAIVWLIVGVLILINFLWELFTDALEHVFWNKNRHIIVMMEKLYKELTIVGIWSVLLFVLTSTFGVSNPTLKHIFELIHLSLFGLVLIYIAVVIFMALLSLVMFRRFHILEELDEGEVMARYQQLRERLKASNPIRRMVDVVSLAKHWTYKTHHNYYTYRAYFIKQLELDDSFHFDAYLKRAMKGTFTEWAQIHWSVLAVVLVFQLAIWVAFVTFQPDHKGVPYTILAVICFCSFLVLSMKIDMVYMTLKERPEIWSLPDLSRYQEAEEQKLHEHATSAKEKQRVEDFLRKDGECEIALDEESAGASEEHSESILGKPDFHSRAHESSSEDDTDSAHHRHHRKKESHHRKASKAAFAHYSSSSDDSFISAASWVSTWESETSWESIVDEEEGVRRQRHLHHHHHHHHHHAHHTKHHHQSDLLWISGCLWPFLRCRLRPSDIRMYLRPSPHQATFWFGSPGFFLYLCHLSTFWQATVFAIIIGSFFGFLEVHWGYWIVPTLLSLWNLFVFIPLILYHYSFCMNVGEFSKWDFIRQVSAKHRTARATKSRKRASLSSLRSDSFNSELGGSTSPSPRSVSEFARQAELLAKPLPAHPRLRQLNEDNLREDSLSKLVMSSPARYSSSSSSE